MFINLPAHLKYNQRTATTTVYEAEASYQYPTCRASSVEGGGWLVVVYLKTFFLTSKSTTTTRRRGGGRRAIRDGEPHGPASKGCSDIPSVEGTIHIIIHPFISSSFISFLLFYFIFVLFFISFSC